MSTENEPKFAFRAPKAGEWYLDGDSMAVPTYAVMTLDTKHWVIVKPVPEPAPWPGPEHKVIVITGISNSKSPQRILALRDTCGYYRDENGHTWYKSDREYDAVYITSWEPYGPSSERREYTADDLDDLPEGTCVWDEDGDVWQKRDSIHWRSAVFSSTHPNPLRCVMIFHAYSAPPEEG